MSLENELPEASQLTSSDLEITTEELVRLDQLKAKENHYFWAQQYWRIQGGNKLDFDAYSYLIDLYDEKAPDVVYKKAGQIGFSELMLSGAFFVGDTMSLTAGYFFPATSQLGDFVRLRVDPVIERSPYLLDRTARGGVDWRKKASDNMGLKSIGKGFVLFRGAQTDRQLTSVSLDAVFLDEVDRFGSFSIPMIEKRMINSKLRWKRMASTPTFEGKGIDLEIQGTTQHEWNIKCKGCKAVQTLDYWENVDQKQAILVCRKCKKPLSNEEIRGGEWLAKYPQRKRRGYIAGGLMSPTLMQQIPGHEKTRLQEIIENMDSNNLFIVQEAHNQDLGLTYEANASGVTDAMLDACQGDYVMPYNRQFIKSCYAGVDVGRISYFVLFKDNEKTGKPQLIFASELHDLETDVSKYMDYFDISALVIDAQPETNLVTTLVNKYPGRIFACHYDYSKPVDGGFLKWYPYAVNAHRTASLDDVYGRIAKREIELPKHAKFIKGFYDHFKNQKRVLGERNGAAMYVYEDNGKPDHYAHAANYGIMARAKVPADLDASIGSRQSTPRTMEEAVTGDYLDDEEEDDDASNNIKYSLDGESSGFNKDVF